MARQKVLNLEKIIFDKDKLFKAREELKNRILKDFDKVKNESTIVRLNSETTIEVVNKELIINLFFLKFIQGQTPEVIKEAYSHIEELWYDSEVFGTNMPSYWDSTIPIISDIEDINIHQLNYDIADVISEYASFLIKVDMVNGCTLSLYNFMKAITEDPELMELTSGDVSYIHDYAEISKEISRRRERFEQILKEKHPDLFMFLKCNNPGQYEQLFIGLGPKANIYGQMIEHVPNTNFLHGMQCVEDYYTLAQVTRKILVTSHKSVSNSGYLARKIGLLLIDTALDLEVDDCGSKHYLEVLIDSKDTLERLQGRFYKDGRKIKAIRRGDDSFIGKTILLRSPVTCCAKNGICKTCYGKLWKINREFHIGILAALYLSSVLTQRLLSAKHLLRSKAPILKWPEEFLANFSVEKSDVIVNPDSNATLIIKDDELTEDEDTGMFYVDRIELVKGKKDPIAMLMPESLWLCTNFFEIANRESGCYEVPLKNFGDEILFMLLVKNEEMTSSLNRITKIIDNKDHLGYDENYHVLYKAIIDILNTNKITISSVHIELIVRELLMDADEERRPDFSQENPEIVINRLSDVIYKRETLSPALAFEHISKQLNNPKTFKKDRKSNMDPFFV